MNENLSPDPNEPPQKAGAVFIGIALCLGFAPSALVMSLITFNPHAKPGTAQLAFFGTIACCFISSFMLFSRRTGLAVVAGILFFLLNAVIAFFFGCAALFGG